MSLEPVCPEFAPGQDAAICTCKVHWNHHSPHAKQAFFQNCTEASRKAVISACLRDSDSPCPGYEIGPDWPLGTPTPDCTCGRPRASHKPGDLLKGMRAWEVKHGPRRKILCGAFQRGITSPGTCQACSRKWIEHNPVNRGLVVETFIDLHDNHCKCILQVGDVECSCMTPGEIQAALDKLSEPKKMCKQFKPKSQGNSICECGSGFYVHSLAACNNYQHFMKWRAAHLSNAELIEWFKSLPGKNQAEQIKFLEKLLADPNATHTAPPHLVEPNYTTMLGLLEVLDGGAYHRIKIKQPAIVVEAKVIHEEDLKEEPRRYLCHSCQEMESTVPGAWCASCSAFMASKIIEGPVARLKGGS